MPTIDNNWQEEIPTQESFREDLKIYLVNGEHMSPYREVRVLKGVNNFFQGELGIFKVSIGRLQEVAIEDLELKVILVKHGY